MKNMQQDMEDMDDKAEAGRATDTVLGHLSLGEVVIPRAFLDDADFLAMLKGYFEENDEDLAEFTVGDKANKINPETGYPEFFKFKKFFRKIAPFAGFALNFIPGLQGLGTTLGTALGATAGAGASTLGNAILGGGLGALSGGGRGALIGALGGGLGANIGNLDGGALPDGMQGPIQQGSGLLGSLSSTTGLTSADIPSLGGLIGGTGGGSSFAPSLVSAFGGLQQDAALKKIRNQQLQAQDQQLENLDSFDPSGITQDPGYEFQRQQGEEALNRSLGARGSLFSGEALKAASEYNQNYANNAFNDYYKRWLNKTGAKNQIYGNRGDINANATLGRSNNLSQSLANAFGANVGNYSSPDDIRRLLGLRGYYA